MYLHLFPYISTHLHTHKHSHTATYILYYSPFAHVRLYSLFLFFCASPWIDTDLTLGRLKRHSRGLRPRVTRSSHIHGMAFHLSEGFSFFIYSLLLFSVALSPQKVDAFACFRSYFSSGKELQKQNTVNQQAMGQLVNFLHRHFYSSCFRACRQSSLSCYRVFP